MAAPAVGSVRIDLLANLAQWSTGLNKAEKQLATFSTKVLQSAASINAVGQKLSLAITAPLGIFGGFAIRAAAEAEALQGDFNLAFGNMSDEVQAWAEATGDALGRSTQTIQKSAVSFQQLFEDIAPTEEAAAQLSMRFVELSEDFAGFNNVSSEQAVSALQGALAGAGKAVKKLGVDISDGALQQRAFDLGIAKSNVALTEQQKTLARASIIMQGFQKIQGDVASDQDETGEKMRRSREQFNELLVTVGDKLLPVFNTFLDGINGLLDGFNNLDPSLQTFIVQAGAMAAALGPVVIGVGGLVTAFGGLLVAGGKVASVLAGIVSFFPRLMAAHQVAAAIRAMGVASDTAAVGTEKLRKGSLALKLSLLALLPVAYEAGRAIGQAFQPNLQTEQVKAAGLLIGLQEKVGLSANEARQAVKWYYAELAAGRKPTMDQVIAQGRLIESQQKLATGAALTASILAHNDATKAAADEKSAIDDLISSLGDLGGETKKVTDEYASLRATLDPVGEGLKEYETQLAAAVRLGYDATKSADILGKAFLSNVSGVDGFRDALKNLPPELQAIVARQDAVTKFISDWKALSDQQRDLEDKRKKAAEDAADAAQAAVDGIRDYGAYLTQQFDPLAVYHQRIAMINDAFRLGAINADVFAKAKAAAFADTPEGQKQLETFDKLSDFLTEAVTSVDDLGDAIERMIMDMLKTQIIKPFIENSLSGLFPQIAPNVTTPGAGGIDFGSIANGVASFFGFGGTRDRGGDAVPGMTYKIGSGVQEWFKPDTAGTISRTAPLGGERGGVSFKIYANDPNEFRNSERQMKRRAQRQFA